MWKLMFHSFKISNNSRNILLKSNCKYKLYNYNQIKYYQNASNTFKKCAPKSKLTFSFCSKIGATLTVGGIFKIVVQNEKVLCEEKKNRIVGYNKIEAKKVQFDWARFYSYFKPYIWYFIGAVIGAFVVATLSIKIPQLMGGFINILLRFDETKDVNLFLSEVKKPAAKMLVLYIAQSLSTFFYIFMLAELGENMAYQMKKDLFSSILKQDVAFFDQHRTGEIINRLTSDIQDFKSSFKQTVSVGLKSIAQIAGSSVSLVMISPHMTLVILLCVPTVIALGSVFGALLRNTSRKAHDQVEKTTAIADEAISNIRTVRAFAMEDQEFELYETEAEIAKNLNINLGFGIGWFEAGTNLFSNCIVLGTLCIGGYLLTSEKITGGEVVAFLMASQTIQKSLGQMSLLFGSVIRGMAAGSKIFEYINHDSLIPLKGGEFIPEDQLKGDIEFKNVRFAYPTRTQQMILKNFNLKIPAGKTMAIVGASGNGKSTIIALLERFYEIKDGSITIDNHDLRTLDPSWLRTRVLGLINQEPILFHTSVMENIRYGRPSATDYEVKEAAKLANAHGFITDFPNGYDTFVGDRGATLSGGQKQRIAIARALLKNPAILLLDEATSALDTESEKIVQSALDKAKAGRTVVVIAHRLSTVQNADIIVVLRKGQIVEIGTHDSLLQLKGYYWTLNYQEEKTPPPSAA